MKYALMPILVAAALIGAAPASALPDQTDKEARLRAGLAEIGLELLPNYMQGVMDVCDFTSIGYSSDWIAAALRNSNDMNDWQAHQAQKLVVSIYCPDTLKAQFKA